MTAIRCALFSPSELIDDKIEPMWAPPGCHRSIVVSEPQLPDGWECHGGYYLCPNCVKLWNEKFDNLKSLMEEAK